MMSSVVATGVKSGRGDFSGGRLRWGKAELTVRKGKEDCPVPLWMALGYVVKCFGEYVNTAM